MDEEVSNAQLKESIWRFLAAKVGDRDCEDFEITLYNPQDATEVGVWVCDIYAGTWAVDGQQIDVFSFSIKDATPEPTGSGGYPYDYV